MKNNKGFTLIELLIVIAIIGLLATIVLVSLESAKNKAKNTKIIADIKAVRDIAELMRNDYESYANLCSAGNLNLAAPAPYGEKLTQLRADLTANNAGGSINCSGSATKFCISYSLNGGGNHCIDYTGKIGNYYCIVVMPGFLIGQCI